MLVSGVQHDSIYVCIVKSQKSNIHYHTISKNVLVLKTFKICSFNSFQIYNTVLVTITMKYITLPGLIFLVIESLYLLIIISILLTPRTLPVEAINLFTVSVNFIVFILDSTYKWNHTVSVFLLTYFKCCNTINVHPYCFKW